MQSFVVDPSEDPYNGVLQPGQAAARHPNPPALPGRQAVPNLLGAGRRHPQGPNLLQFFLNVVSRHGRCRGDRGRQHHQLQMRESFGDHLSFPGPPTLEQRHPPWVRQELTRMGYALEVFEERT